MKFILRYLKPYWKLCAVTLFLMLADIFGALLIPTFVGEMINDGATQGMTFSTIFTIGIWMAVVALLSGSAAILGGYTCSVLTARVGKDMRNDLYRKSLKLSVSDFRTFGVASFTTRTTSDVANIQFALLSLFQMVLPVPAVFIFSLSLAFIKDWLMGLIMLGILAVIALLSVFIMKSSSPLFKKLQKLLDRMSTVLLENITGVRVVRAFNKQEHEVGRMDAAFSEYKITSVKANRMFAYMDGFLYSAINIFIIIVFALGGFRISAGNLAPGDITAVIEYAWLALSYMMLAQTVILTLPRAFECSNRLRTIIDYKPQIQDGREIKELQKSDEVIAFRNVSFCFSDAEEPTLRNLNFVCRRGETTAIIGGTGSGKSTVASLILRFNDVTEGALCFNGMDIRRMTQKQLRNEIAYVQQRAWLFSGTIAENLRFGSQNATDEELWHALDIAQAGDFVRSLPQKLGSFVAQGGTNFSGGQKQRLSIARAIVSKPQVYIFDDSFSALDFKTDAALRHALAAETKNAAVIIVAQRISSIRHADQIIVLQEGQPVGIGTHEELLANCPTYCEIYQSQTKEGEFE